VLRLAKGEERFVPLGGKEAEHPEPGEAVYVDAEQVLCRRWNWRQGDGTKITASARNVLINVDCLPPVGVAEAEALVVGLAELVRVSCGGSVRHDLITASQPAVEVG
jgi:lysyl-tRNA synthetase class 2